MEKSGQDLILATKPYAKENRALSWYYTISTLLIYLAVLAGTYWNINLGARIICSLLAGMVCVRLFVIYHDHQHHTILNKSKLANFIFTLFGIWIFAPRSIWKRSHDYHHNHNSKLFSASIGSFPIMTKQKFLTASAAERRMYLTIRNPICIWLGFCTMFIYGMAVQSFLSNPHKHYDSLIALVANALVVTAITYFGGWQAFILTWALPFTLTCGLGSYLFYAQHNFPAATFKDNVDWTYEEAALDSSSSMKMNRVGEWITANIGYHHIHHMNSKIPFYRLKEAMKQIPELQHPKVTSLRPGEIFRCMKLKVWDPEQNRMLTLSEIS